MQPDTQREGPAYRLGQGTTQDQPRGEGKQKQAGGEPTNAKQTKHKQKGPTTQGSTTQREKHQKAQQRKPHTDSIANPKGQSPKGNEATKQGRRTEATTRPSRSRPRKAESEKGGRKSRNPARQGEKGAPHNHSQWEQVILWRPGEEGKVKQASKPKRGRRTEKRGDRYV